MLTPVILCGGSGTRLWPLSRKSYPKQFVPLTGKESLFQSAARRLTGPGYAKPLVVTGSDFRFIAAEQLLAVGIDPGTILIEPEPRNTAPAILAAALHLAVSNPAGLMLISPADHVIGSDAAFRKAVSEGIAAAEAGAIVTFGVKPVRPETGYGWIEAGVGKTPGGVRPLLRFVEKPDAARAAAMLASGQFYWNMGVFLARADTLVAAFQRFAEDMSGPVGEALALARRDLGFTRLHPESWAKARSVSIDYAVMEQTDNLTMVPFDGGWSDLGDWDAVSREVVAPSGHSTAIDCTDTLLRSESDGLELVGIGLKNIIAVAMPDAVLVADRSRAQDVRLVVDALRKKGAAQAERLSREHRPWGWYESLVKGERFQVKRIVVKPKGVLSLQSHVHRAEHWVVVSGTAKVTIDGTTVLLTENQSTYIPLGAVHRLENPGKLPLVLIEVQTGPYLGEDDITRYDDAYARE